MSLFYGASFDPPCKKSVNDLDWDQPVLTQMLGPNGPPVPRVLSLDYSLLVPSSAASTTARLTWSQWGGRSVAEVITLKESSGDAVGNGGDDDDVVGYAVGDSNGDNDIAGYIPLSSKKRRRITDNHWRCSERVEARDRAAAKADKALHREDLAAWEKARAIDARSAKLSAPDSADRAETDLLQNPFLAHSFVPSGQPFTYLHTGRVAFCACHRQQGKFDCECNGSRQRRSVAIDNINEVARCVIHRRIVYRCSRFSIARSRKASIASL